MSEAERIDRERSMFGCTIAELENANGGVDFNDPVGLNILAASILSDVQEVLAIGNADQAEHARLLINRAKHCIFESTRIIRQRENTDARKRA